MKTVAYVVFSMVVLAVCVLVLKPESEQYEPLETPQKRLEVPDANKKPSSSNAKRSNAVDGPSSTEKRPSGVSGPPGVPADPTDPKTEQDQVFNIQSRGTRKKPLERLDGQFTDQNEGQPKLDNAQGFPPPFSQESADSGWGESFDDGQSWPEPEDMDQFSSPFSQENGISSWGASLEDSSQKGFPVDGFGKNGGGFDDGQDNNRDFGPAQ